jgi:hypothetical protein
LLEAVDLVAKLSHPNIHYVPHYRKKLMPAVEHTLKYVDELVVQIPAPIAIGADAWNTNPFVRKTFMDDTSFRCFFSSNPELKAFYQKQNVSRCCALLVMNRKDRKIFGVGVDGDIVKRDVLHTSIDFSDHRIVAPMISESETRKEVSLRALELLASHALDSILSLIALKKDMETEKHILEIKLHLRDTNIRSKESLLPDGAGQAEEITVAHDVLEKIDKEIAEVRLKLDKPVDYLNKVTDLLYHPEQFLRSEPVRIFVDDMNIIIKNGDQRKADEIRFVEFSTSAGLRKAAVLVDCQRF